MGETLMSEDSPDVVDGDLDDIDYDEIIASTEDDLRAERFAYIDPPGATEEEAQAALRRFLYERLKKALGEHSSGTGFAAPGTPRSR